MRGVEGRLEFTSVILTYLKSIDTRGKRFVGPVGLGAPPYQIPSNSGDFDTRVMPGRLVPGGFSLSCEQLTCSLAGECRKRRQRIDLRTTQV
jgi:hypothetical protein